MNKIESGNLFQIELWIKLVQNTAPRFYLSDKHNQQTFHIHDKIIFFKLRNDECILGKCWNL